MTMWMPILEGKSGPKYKLIADAIAESVRNGSLSEGDRLPPQRDLAYKLDMSLNTVSRAYAEAIRRGLVCGEVGRGTYVRGGNGAEAADVSMMRPHDGPIDFALNLPSIGNSGEALAHTLQSLTGSTCLSSYLDYQTERDFASHTEAAAVWIGQIGLDACNDDIVLTNGAQHGLLVALLASMRPGDVLLTEALTYPPIMAMAQHLGLKIFPVSMDESGLLPAALDEACRATAAKALYCLPTLHTPTTITMSAERRNDIAEIAGKHGLVIIEDDVFGHLPPERPPPLACYAPERTFFVTSVSKSVAPGLRVGYLSAPKRFRTAMRAAIKLSCWMPPPLMAGIASTWIEDKIAHRLNNFQRTEAQERQRLASELLATHSPQADPFGLHLWLPLPAHWRPDSFRVAAEKMGVRVLSGETFAVKRINAPNAVRLCLSHEPERDRVTRGLKIVAELLSDKMDPGVLII